MLLQNECYRDNNTNILCIEWNFQCTYMLRFVLVCLNVKVNTHKNHRNLGGPKYARYTKSVTFQTLLAAGSCTEYLNQSERMSISGLGPYMPSSFFSFEYVLIL